MTSGACRLFSDVEQACGLGLFTPRQVVSPLQGSFFYRIQTQGVALGYVLSPILG